MTSPFASGPIEPVDNVIWTCVEDEIVLLSPASVYHGLRGVACRIWELIEERRHDRDGILAELLRQYGADEARVRHDLDSVLAGLAKRGLIRHD